MKIKKKEKKMIWFSLLQQELLELLPIVLRRPHLLVPVLLHQNTYNVRSLLGDGLIVDHMEYNQSSTQQRTYTVCVLMQ